ANRLGERPDLSTQFLIFDIGEALLEIGIGLCVVQLSPVSGCLEGNHSLCFGHDAPAFLDCFGTVAGGARSGLGKCGGKGQPSQQKNQSAHHASPSWRRSRSSSPSKASASLSKSLWALGALASWPIAWRSSLSFRFTRRRASL